MGSIFIRVVALSSLFFISGCSKKGGPKVKIENNSETPIPPKFHKLDKLFVTGDFDGDKVTDTIFQYNYSTFKKAEITYAPDPMQIDWENVVKWFDKQDSDLRLSSSLKNTDILHLGTAQGLYCLINIGDTNNDGKDEIAFVVDECDFSNVNNCLVYSLCNGKWFLAKQFGIYEAAFSWEGDTAPKFMAIKGFLEKQSNVWKYSDYSQNGYDSSEKAGQMQVLKATNCQ